MARGTTLTRLIQMLRAEAGHSTSVAAGQDNEAALIQKLQRVQIMLYDDYDWPFLRDTFDIPLEAGERYYDLPIDLNMERIEAAAINYSDRPEPITRGISFDEYAQYNSDNDERASPARRWDIKRVDDGVEQIEIWPIPTDDTQLFQLRGIKKLRPLVAPADVCDIDDIAIVLSTASELLAKAKATDAASVQSAAAARLKQLKARTKGASRMITMSGSSADSSNRGRTIIRIGSQTN